MFSENKIAFIIHGLPMGGAEKFLIIIANKFFEMGYNPLMILLSEDQNLLHELHHDIKVVTFLKRSRWDLLITNRIQVLLKEKKIKTVFCVNTYAFFLTKLAFIFRNTNIQFFLSIHSTIPSSLKNYLQNIFYYRTLSKNDTIVYLCKNQQQYLEKKYFLSKTKKSIINNGIDLNYFDPKIYTKEEITEFRNQFGLKKDDKVILKVARVRPEKGHQTAIQALSLLHINYKVPAHIFFIGDGDSGYIEHLKDMVRQYSLEKFIHFAGNHSDVRRFYGVADLFTLTSSTTETFSLAALEAMSFGLPCSLTNIGGASEMTIEGVTGFLTQPNNPQSIADSWNNILKKEFEPDRIRQYVIENFSSKKMLENYLALIEKVM